METAAENSRRVGVRDLLTKHGFFLKNEREKSDEFKTADGKAIYFYWKQGGGINIAIDPHVPFDALISIPHVEFSPKAKESLGIRTGTSMTAFPNEYKGYRPKDSKSKVGRLFVIEQTRLSDFIRTLRGIFSGEHASSDVVVDGPPIGIALTPHDAANHDHGEMNIGNEHSSAQGYEQDPEIRRAVELHAESIAARYYESRGYRVQKFGKPYDLLCEKDGESIHVEVKGSRSKLDTVTLTINEVTDAENAAWQSDLFVVDQIIVVKNVNGLTASGGAARVIQKWVPAKEMLSPSEFRYRLPDESLWLFLGQKHIAS